MTPIQTHALGQMVDTYRTSWNKWIATDEGKLFEFHKGRFKQEVDLLIKMQFSINEILEFCPINDYLSKIVLKRYWRIIVIQKSAPIAPSSLYNRKLEERAKVLDLLYKNLNPVDFREHQAHKRHYKDQLDAYVKLGIPVQEIVSAVKALDPVLGAKFEKSQRLQPQPKL